MDGEEWNVRKVSRSELEINAEQLTAKEEETGSSNLLTLSNRTDAGWLHPYLKVLLRYSIPTQHTSRVAKLEHFPAA